LIYQIEIIEILQRIIEVDAEDESSAAIIAKQLYRTEEIDRQLREL